MHTIGDDEMFARCSRSLARRTKANEIPQQASRVSSGWEGDAFILRNARGELARFTFDAASNRVARVK